MSAFSAQKIIAGDSCKILNQKVTQSNKKFTCIKSGKKLIWDKGVVIVKPKPYPSSTFNSNKQIGSNNESCPSVNPEADKLRELAKREILNLTLPTFVTLEIEPGALTDSQETIFRSAIAAGTRFTDDSIPIIYLIPKTKAWFIERWPKEDSSYIDQVGKDPNFPFPAHSLGNDKRYAVASMVVKEEFPIELVQIVSIVLKPEKISSRSFHWYGHSFGGPYGAAISEALGVSCYSVYRQHVVKMAKAQGPDLRTNLNWNTPISGWYQGFLANEYLSGRLGLKVAGNLITDPDNSSEIDKNFKTNLGFDLNGFYNFMIKRLTDDFSKI